MTTRSADVRHCSHGQPLWDTPRLCGADIVTREVPMCNAPCEISGALVLHGMTQAGDRLILNTPMATGVGSWDYGGGVPRLERSRGYAEHRC
jgi:hypothetical protein